ncbi:MAG: T9SS type A sorting domain-containing protein [Bacteroidia bacterium]|nr:T9SS type A sorting domain-containing protein [Bacteroidia bacterium]
MKKLFTTFFVLLSIISIAQEIKWQNMIGGSSNEKLTSIIQTSDGGILLGGTTNTTTISGDITQTTYNLLDYCIFKTDSNGIVLWQNAFGANADDYMTVVIETNDGGFLLGGYSASAASGDKSENPKGGYDFWILKTDANGIKLWDKTIGGSLYEKLYSVVQTADGGYLLGGYSQSNISGDKSENSKGNYDYWIVKIDPLGNVIWDKTIGGALNDFCYKLVPILNGNLLLGGISESPISGDKTENSGDLDYWIVSIDSVGDINWQNTIQNNGDVFLSALLQTADGGLILGGGKNGNSDYYVVKSDSVGNVNWQKNYKGYNSSGPDKLTSVITTADGGLMLAGYSSADAGYDKSEDSWWRDWWIIKTDSSGNIEWDNTLGGSSYEYDPQIIQTANGDYLVGGHSGSSLSGDISEITNGIYDFWILSITEKFNRIRGKTYADLDSNQSQNSSDPGIPYLKITESNSGRFTFSQPTGFYNLLVLDSGNFVVSPDYVNLFNPVPLVHSGNFSSVQQIDSLNDFAFQPTGSFNDLCISISPLGNFRSGFNANYAINYSNIGNTTLIPTIVFYPDNNVTFVSASISPTSVTPDSVVFVLGAMNPFQFGQITITVNVNTGLPIGTLINSGALILPIANDANPGCNSSFWEVFTTGSFDPNDIIVNRKFIYDYEIPAPPDLEYIIRFQNTGNDTAFTVTILNPIDTNRLDLSTLELAATSHSADIQFVYHASRLEFVMNNILLPDSNINEPLSHGFVRYRIKPKTTVAVGDSIQSFASIYFDFNTPVITNTAVTKIIQPTGVQEIPQGNISIFPNPTTNKVTIRLTETAEKITSANVFNIYGQEVKAFRISPTHTTEIDISDLSQGIYFIRLNNSNQLISKIVKY